jgi:hypothetical protein
MFTNIMKMVIRAKELLIQLLLIMSILKSKDFSNYLKCSK